MKKQTNLPEPDSSHRKIPVTMQQVARAAGVHQTTVSLALRHHPSIPEATRNRILQVAAQLGYRPNPLVSTLMSQLRSQRRRTNSSGEVIAFINFHPPAIPIYHDFSLINMFEGAKKRAELLGFSLEVFNRYEPNMTSQRLRKILISRGIKALILGPMLPDQTALSMDLSGFAAVSLGSSLRSPALERIASDHYQCMQLAFANCVRLGYRRIGAIIDKTFSTRLENRWLSAFLSAQHELPPSSKVRPLLSTLESNQDEWFRQESPDVIISPLADRWRWVQTRFPKVGFANLTRKPGDANCAGIDQKTLQIGGTGVERVIARLHQNSFGALEQMQSTLLHGTWVDGASLLPKNGRTKN